VVNGKAGRRRYKIVTGYGYKLQVNEMGDKKGSLKILRSLIVGKHVEG
jgi:hypothetical protein